MISKARFYDCQCIVGTRDCAGDICIRLVTRLIVMTGNNCTLILAKGNRINGSVLTESVFERLFVRALPAAIVTRCWIYHANQDKNGRVHFIQMYAAKVLDCCIVACTCIYQHRLRFIISFYASL